MNPEVLQQIEQHALSQPDREVCGFVYADRYVPLRNQLVAYDRFEANPADVAAALSQYGEPLAVFHTHPNGVSQPSAVDLQRNYYINSTMVIGTIRSGRLVLHLSKKTQRH